LNERHHEYGLPPQMLASVGSAAYERGKSDPASYWARRKGLLSDQDKVKEGVDLALEHLAEIRSADLAGMDRSDRMQAFDEALATVTDGDVSVSLRELKSGEMKLRSFRVAGRARPLAHKTLGPRYGDTKIQDQLEQVAQGTGERMPADAEDLDRSERMQAVDEALATVTDGDVSVSLRELKSGEMKLRSFRVAGRARPLAHKTLGPRYGDTKIQDQLEQVAQGTWERMPAHQ